MAIVVPGAPFPVIMADSGAVSAFSRLNVSLFFLMFNNMAITLLYGNQHTLEQVL